MSSRCTEGKKYAYRVVRIVRETYLVESDEPLESVELIWGQLTHPQMTELQSENIQQVKP